jgi:hypothetical protein
MLSISEIRSSSNRMYFNSRTASATSSKDILDNATDFGMDFNGQFFEVFEFGASISWESMRGISY